MKYRIWKLKYTQWCTIEIEPEGLLTYDDFEECDKAAKLLRQSDKNDNAYIIQVYNKKTGV